MAYCCNIFLSCYDLYDDVSTSEFKYMICESNISHSILHRLSRNVIFKKILKGVLKGVKQINIPIVYKLIYGI